MFRAFESYEESAAYYDLAEEEVVDEALSTESSAWKPHFKLGTISLEMGMLLEAQESFARAHEINPRHPTIAALMSKLGAADVGSVMESIESSVAIEEASHLTMAGRLVDVDVAQATSVVRVPRFLSDEEMESLHRAASSVRDDVGSVDRKRSATPHSWSTVYLNHRLALLLPDLAKRIRGAVRRADDEQGWGLFAPAFDDDDDDTTMESSAPLCAQVGVARSGCHGARHRPVAFRCAEYHTVSPGGGLPATRHYDHGSLATVDIMLSNTADFEGGELMTLETDGALERHAFERGDLLIFQSHKYHCVAPVTAGTRNVLVCELWEGYERRCPQRCSVPTGPCPCEFRDMSWYSNKGEGRFEKVDFGWSPMC